MEWKAPKTSQGNVGNHYMEQNIDVWVPGSDRPIEFELTRDPHMKDMPGRPFTVPACFKNAPMLVHGDAWRILLHVCKGRELLPAHVQDTAPCTTTSARTRRLDTAPCAPARQALPAQQSRARIPWFKPRRSERAPTCRETRLVCAQI